MKGVILNVWAEREIIVLILNDFPVFFEHFFRIKQTNGNTYVILNKYYRKWCFVQNEQRLFKWYIKCHKEWLCQ